MKQQFENSEGLERQTLSVVEAAKIMGVGKSVAYEAAKTGQIPSVRIGNRILVLKKAFYRMLEGEAA